MVYEIVVELMIILAQFFVGQVFKVQKMDGFLLSTPREKFLLNEFQKR